MKRKIFQRLSLPLVLTMLLTTVSCAPLAREHGGALNNSELIGYLSTVMTNEESDTLRERYEELVVSGNRLEINQNAIPAKFDEETYAVSCDAFEGYELIYILSEDHGRSSNNGHFTGGGTHVYAGQGTTMKGTLLYDTTGIAKIGSARRFDREPTAADFGGKAFTVYQVEDDDGTVYWEAKEGEELLADLYAVYLTAEGECYLERTSVSMVLSGEADGGSSGLSAKQEVSRTDSSGKTEMEFLSAEVTFHPSLPYELRSITQFDENHCVISVTEFAAGEAPEEIAWEENAAYMMAERSYVDPDGTLQRTYDTITEDDRFYIYPLWNGSRVADHDSITLSGRIAEQ